MTTAENSVLYYEDGQTYVPMTELTDSGDHKSYDSNAECWSDEAGCWTKPHARQKKQLKNQMIGV